MLWSINRTEGYHKNRRHFSPLLSLLPISRRISSPWLATARCWEQRISFERRQTAAVFGHYAPASATPSSSHISPHSITPTSPKLPRMGKFRGSRRAGISAEGTSRVLSRTCRGHHGEVGIVEFGLYAACWAAGPPTAIRQVGRR